MGNERFTGGNDEGSAPKHTFRGITEEYALFAARTSNIASRLVHDMTAFRRNEGARDFARVMSTYVAGRIIIPDDSDYFPPSYIFHDNDNVRNQSHIVSYGYSPRDEANKAKIPLVVNHVHEALQGDPLPKGSYDVSYRTQWDDNGGFQTDAQYFYGMNRMNGSFIDGTQGSLTFSTDERSLDNFSNRASVLDIRMQGSLEPMLDTITHAIAPTHALTLLDSDANHRLMGSRLWKLGLVTRTPPFSFDLLGDQWSEFSYLIPFSQMEQAGSIIGNPIREDAIYGLVKVYSGSEHERYGDRARDVRTLAAVAHDPSYTFHAEAVAPYRDIASYAAQVPRNSAITEINIKPGEKSRNKNRLAIGRGELVVESDLNDPSLHPVQSQAAAIAGIKFV